MDASRICVGCDTTFAPNAAHQIYCTSVCRRRIQRRELRRKKRDQRLAAIAAAGGRKCKQCGIRIDDRHHLAKFCKKLCRSRHHFDRVRKEREAKNPCSIEERKPRKQYMVLTDRGRECRPEEILPGESIARFFVKQMTA